MKTKFDDKLIQKLKQIEKLQNEVNVLKKKQENEIKKMREKNEKMLGEAIVKFIENERKRPVDDNEDEQMIQFLKDHNYL